MILLELYAAFFKIGLFSVGGGYVMLPLIQKEIIEARQWLSLTEFVNILAVAEMTPGPIAINFATFIGYRTAGLLGSAFATAGVVTPSAVLMVLAATLFARFYENRWVQAAFSGLRPAVVALIIGAAVFVGRVSLIDVPSVIIGAGAFLLFVFTRLHPLLILLLSVLTGIIMSFI
jgi:chromate transporter